MQVTVVKSILKRYLNLLFANYRYSLMFLLEYRADFFVSIFQRILNLFLSVFLLNIIFLQTPTLSGWTRYELFIIYGCFLMVFSLIKAFFDEGLSDVPLLVRTGRLDVFLTKPVNSRFLISIRFFSFDYLFDVLFSFFIIAYSLKNLQIQPAFGDLLIFFLVVISGVLVFYFIYFFLITFSIWFIKLDNLRNLFSGFMDLARVPPSLYKGAVGFFFTFIVPLAFVSVVPAQAILGLLSPKTVLLEIGVVIFFCLISAKFWKFALRYYTSASS